MSLAEASEARKSRLSALRRRKAGEKNTGDGVAGPILLGRNFDPETRTLRKHQTEEIEDTVERAVDGLAERIIMEDEERRAQDLDLFNIAPKRPNWDLKRDVEKKLAKLDRQTQQAVHTLIRRRLAAQKGESDDLVEAMRVETEASAMEPISDGEEDEDTV
ncbi:cwf18 pre-mRNA splicing factor-domain-containing protein [Vararia minispora EC-137]|uniref:Cwf18 pre-mRNA splicing factor-domain-containing protein n=1 Tax=Vararia minispora EC-137 TaxID=1314806 RepID=A0ACB8QLR5_9AGAM|nr:cwf18 pre-mRNA splicing factor-domain-containing protein [Vararia minispora EC-137]